MRTILINCGMSTLLLFIQPDVYANSNTVPFTSTANFSYNSLPEPATVADFTCSVQDNRVSLNWMVTNNQTADRLIIQRSRNGKKFDMIGLVFASEKNDTDAYKFFEKLDSKKSYYRIIIVRKDQSVEYSGTIRLLSAKN